MFKTVKELAQITAALPSWGVEYARYRKERRDRIRAREEHAAMHAEYQAQNAA